MTMPAISLEGKVALVTGAAGGLGSAIAQRLGAAGAKVFLAGRAAGPLEELAARLRRDGVIAVPCTRKPL